MTFKDVYEARSAVNFYALVNKRGLVLKKKTDRTRASYKCQEGCPFRLYISTDNKKNSTCLSIKTFIDKHTCQPAFKNPRADQNTLAQLFKKKVQCNPKYKVKDLRGELENNFDLNVTKAKLKRAKLLTLQKLEGSFVDDYKKLEAYGQEVRQSNPGTDVVINISRSALEEGKRKFLRMYICFNALKKGWKGGLRPLIGVDGTFLKGRYKGQMLVALAQDSMN
ncbi:uncharacterized protein LOC132628837 [Lycium barbarum]|uniref:uncharacterized protein LOC132628837 n=1 Tax=Lycium barbarum TaxID=112863 RepID=UPI00293EDE08|nr:uncharacterized protein LOC132628837 [Lycium barbarum]